MVKVQKILQNIYDENIMKYKRAKSSNVEKNKRTNNMGKILMKDIK